MAANTTEESASTSTPPLTTTTTTTTTSADDRKCWACQKPIPTLNPDVNKQCSKCRKAYFCNQACFKKGWKNHQKHCHFVAIPVDREPDAHTRAAKSREEQKAASAALLPTPPSAQPQIIHAQTNPDARLPEGFIAADEAKPESTTTTSSAEPAPEKKKLTPAAGKTNVTGDAAPLDAKVKARLQAMVGSGRGGNIHTVTATGARAVLTQAEVPEGAVVCFINCHDCEYTLECTCVKLFIQSCTDFKIKSNGKVITSTLEMYQCERIHAIVAGQVHTVQADLNKDVVLEFPNKESFKMVVWTGCYNLTTKVGEFELVTGFEQMKQEYKNLREDIGQFKIHFLHDKLVAEKVFRLDNGFPTTKREADEFDRTQEENLQRRAKEMGITIHKKPTGPKIGRNDPCTCGSGKKYKACCIKL